MKLPFLVRLALVVLATWLGGCATFPGSSNLALTVVDLRPVSAALLEINATLTLRLVNESAAPISLSGSSHRLSLNGLEVGRAVNSDRIVVPAFGTVTQQVTVHLENLALVRLLRGLSANPQVAYRLQSRLYSNEGQSSRSAAVSASGSLELGNLGDFLAP